MGPSRKIRNELGRPVFDLHFQDKKFSLRMGLFFGSLRMVLRGTYNAKATHYNHSVPDDTILTCNGRGL